MSLTKQDLADIHNLVLEALDVVVNPRFDRIEAQLDEHSETLAQHTATLAEHSKILAQHTDTLAEHGRRLSSIENLLADLDGRLSALENDVKELYGMAGQPTDHRRNKKFAALPPEQRLRQIYGEVLTLAREMHVEL